MESIIIKVSEKEMVSNVQWYLFHTAKTSLSSNKRAGTFKKYFNYFFSVAMGLGYWQPKKMEKEGKSKKSLNHKFPQQQLLITFTLFLIKNLNFLNLFSKGIVHSAM